MNANLISSTSCYLLLAFSFLVLGCGSNKPNSSVLFHCTFDSEEAIRHPDVGPDAEIVTGLSFVPGLSGRAITVDRGTSLAYYFPTNTFGPKGTFIVKARLVTDDDVCHVGPCFFNLQQFSEKTRKGPWCYLSYCTNNGEAHSGYCGAVLNPRGATIDGFWRRFKYSDTLGESWKDWHEFRMSWNLSDTTQKALVTLYIDNKPIATNYRTGFNLESLVNAWIRLPGCLAFGQSPFGHRTDEPYQIDDFTILNTDCPEVAK